MILLQLDGSMFGISDMLKSAIGEMTVLTLLKAAAVIYFLYWALSEPIKLYARRNIGRKAFSLPAAIAASTLFLGAGIIALGAINAYDLSIQQKLYYVRYNLGIYEYELSSEEKLTNIVYKVWFILNSILCCWAAFRILSRAMHEYYRGLAQNSQDWKVLEYRGDSKNYSKYQLKGYTKEEVWRKVEPKRYMIIALLFLPVPAFGLLLLISAISFYIHEWYHLSYMPFKQIEAMLNLKIESDKARQQYNSGNVSQEVPRVKEC